MHLHAYYDVYLYIEFHKLSINEHHYRYFFRQSQQCSPLLKCIKCKKIQTVLNFYPIQSKMASFNFAYFAERNKSNDFLTQQRTLLRWRGCMDSHKICQVCRMYMHQACSIQGMTSPEQKLPSYIHPSSVG